MLNEIKKELADLGNKEKSEIYQRFFKTGPGQYGEGDIFLGLTAAEQKSVVKKYIDLSLEDLQKLLDSKIHEHRSSALAILTKKYKKSNNKKEIIDFYLKNTKRINNWDLVDCSAPHILGDYLFNTQEKKKILYKLAKSDNLWEKRISILATFSFIRQNEYEDTLNISEILLNDKHDLIHKAVGWMLRELGKRDQDVEEEFLKKYHKTMPRTMLRYSIERFSEEKRKFYMKK